MNCLAMLRNFAAGLLTFAAFIHTDVSAQEVMIPLNCNPVLQQAVQEAAAKVLYISK